MNEHIVQFSIVATLDEIAIGISDEHLENA